MLIVWGAGEGGMCTLRILRAEGRHVDRLVDSDQAKHGRSLYGLTVEDPAVIQSGDTVIVASAWADQILYRLRRRGIYDWEATPLWWSLTPPGSEVDWPACREVEERCRLSSSSRLTYREILSSWVTRDISLVLRSPYRTSHVGALFKGCSHVLDGGAYDLADARDWLAYRNVGQVTCVDPIHHPGLHPEAGITVIHAALGPRREEVQISEAGSTTRVVGHYESAPLTTAPLLTVQALPLSAFDDPIHVDGIKLDIEGAEVETLDSASEWLADRCPQLAVSIYHRMSDLWTIPLLLVDLFPEAHYHLHHFSGGIPETMLLVDHLGRLPW